ncbi:bifunctional diguanylate cyclase/phosphodiesterase [Pararhizobium gei]|uniref:bifunctional diguanylate cyclase/phosphodiesterase n=1 Tax=Pararhizobium gei TaxID=1395951 RepID=UPI0023D9DF8A|nr:EAL domain-containing protein [Rhizobium gei]
MQKRVLSASHVRQLSVVAVASVFIVVASILGGLVARAVGTLTATANEIDDNRARHAADSAMQSLTKQLGATLRDNAYWDDAYNQVTSSNGPNWSIETWGSVSADYPLYDTAAVIGRGGKPVMAYRDGEPMQNQPSQFFGGFDALVDAARQTGMDDPVPVHFVRTPGGTAIIGAAAIQPSEPLPSAKGDDLHVLVFAKQITPQLIEELSQTFNLPGLRLSDLPAQGLLNVALLDVSGDKVAFAAWPSEAPGTESLGRVKGDLQAAAVLLVVFLCGIGAAGALTILNLKASEQRSRDRASHDALTGLFNRAGLLEKIATSLSAAASGDFPVMLYFIDLDGFKGVNDAWGHMVGDDLIVAVAHRLRDRLPKDAVISRLGGDEFAVVASQAYDTELGQQIQQAITTEFLIGDRTIEIGASVGVAVSPFGRIEASELIRRADTALYRAKALGRGITVGFDNSFDEDTTRLTRLEGLLRATLNNQDIGVAFQPLIDAASGRICGIEALARWHTETGESISPDIFIPLAERSGLIDLLGAQILKKSLMAAANWPDIGLSVNVSPLQLKNPHFARQVITMVEAMDFDPSRLCLELTEGALVSDPEQARRALDAVKAAGIRIALDDFGSGFASIGMLRQFGFDRIKIDRSLIAATDRDLSSGAFLHATIALAHALNIPVTAEGIEKEEQAISLRLSGCNALQGYFFSKPVAEQDITERYFSNPTGDNLSAA